MPKVTNPPTKKVDPKICDIMLKRSHGQIGIFCDLLEIAPITYTTNFKTNSPTLLKARWQSAIKRTLGMPDSKNINVPILKVLAEGKDNNVDK